MKSADYRCQNEICKETSTYYVGDGKEIPKEIKCKGCNSIKKRIYSPLPSIVHQGSVGNYKNGYTSTGGNIKKS